MLHADRTLLLYATHTHLSCLVPRPMAHEDALSTPVHFRMFLTVGHRRDSETVSRALMAPANIRVVTVPSLVIRLFIACTDVP